MAAPARLPNVTVREQRRVGFEALLRWSNPELGAVSPADFVPIAERTGLIILIYRRSSVGR